MKKGDRVRVKNYDDNLDGHVGVLIATPDDDRSIFYEVALDEPVVGMTEWLLRADEIEKETP